MGGAPVSSWIIFMLSMAGAGLTVLIATIAYEWWRTRR